MRAHRMAHAPIGWKPFSQGEKADDHTDGTSGRPNPVHRGHRVMLDADLAVLYGVTTGALNQAVKRNAERFPGDFMFRLTAEEGAYLKSQIVISNRSTLPL